MSDECTCHPDERPTPCMKKYAWSECMAASLAAKDVQLAVLREQTLDECEAIARGERCVDDTGDWSDEAYNRACDHITDAIAALKSKGERDDK